MSDPTSPAVPAFARDNYLVATRIKPDLEKEGYDVTTRYAHRKEHATGATELRPFMHLKIVPDDPHGKTHHLKSHYHFSAMTKGDFLANFEKVTDDSYKPSATPEEELEALKVEQAVNTAKGSKLTEDEKKAKK